MSPLSSRFSPGNPGYVLLDTRLHVEQRHHPLLHRFLQIPDLRLVDALPALAEEGLRWHAGCAVLFEAAPKPDWPPTHTSDTGRLSRRLRVSLSAMAYTFLCAWLDSSPSYGSVAVEMRNWLERGLEVRWGLMGAATTQTVPSPTAPPPLPENRTPEVSTPAQAPAVESTLEDRQRKRAQLQTFANLGG